MPIATGGHRLWGAESAGQEHEVAGLHTTAQKASKLQSMRLVPWRVPLTSRCPQSRPHSSCCSLVLSLFIYTFAREMFTSKTVLKREWPLFFLMKSHHHSSKLELTHKGQSSVSFMNIRKLRTKNIKSLTKYHIIQG